MKIKNIYINNKMEMKTNDLEKELIEKYKLKQKIYDRQRYEKQKELLQQKYINNRTEIREKQKNYYANNKNRYINYYNNNKERILAYNRAYKLQKKEANKSM